ncbi:aldehyde dehydrogenase family protein [Rhodotorula paludigena]|uniref:aldehyde dehydrogenase family protein n=1 Tax=Rhodotorula paludigena TaxID=86838 RepID=UPI0031774BBE
MSVPQASLTFPEGHSVKSLDFPVGLFINNEFVAGEGGKTIEVKAPSTGKTIAHVAEGSANDVDRAVEAAQKAYDTVWGERCPGHQRGKLLMKLADLFDEHNQQLASIEALDNGKAYSIASGFDVSSAAACLRYYGGWADKEHGKVVEVDDSKLAITKHEPIGVVGQIIPWNFPLLMFAWKLGPALATGNCIVMKTAETTPLSAFYACQLIAKVFPPGVVNILTGYGNVVGAAISSHMKILKVAFTGSTLVGRQIMKAASQSNLKPVTLELGGKSPNVIFDDADIEQAVSWGAFGLYFNAGQCCCAGSRIFVQETIYDEFLEKLTAKVKSIKVGDPFAADSFQGPATSQLQFDRISAHIQAGKDEGATVHLGGNRHGTEGYFIEPTIFTDVQPTMKIAQEEIFGPVVVVQKFKDEEDLIARANDTVYGLAAAVFSRDISRCLRIANKLQAGTVWINQYNMLDCRMPFGGFKQSGIGRELGEYALKNYTAVKAIHINISAPNPL